MRTAERRGARAPQKTPWRVLAACIRFGLRDGIEYPPRFGVVALALRRQSQLAGGAVKQPRTEVTLQRGDVPADIGLPRSQFPGNRRETPRLYNPRKAVHEEDAIHRAASAGDIYAIKE